MLRTLLTVSLAALLFRASSGPAAQPDPKKELSPEAEKARKLVEEFLAMHKATGANVNVITDTTRLGKVFRDHQFVAVHFSEWPVPRMPPAPLQMRNLFIVDKDGKVLHLTDARGLEKFFRDHVPALKPGTNKKALVEVWLRLDQEFVQDGFYKFDKLDKTAITTDVKDGDEIVSGSLDVVPEMGNKGTLGVVMRFNAQGELTRITKDNKVIRGIRPKCQATRLLDADPQIRAICEQDILVMGRAAYEYLMEQRALANRPLRRAIDQLWQKIVEEGR
jgi:hypothetical protein